MYWRVSSASSAESPREGSTAMSHAQAEALLALENVCLNIGRPSEGTLVVFASGRLMLFGRPSEAARRRLRVSSRLATAVQDIFSVQLIINGTSLGLAPI